MPLTLQEAEKNLQMKFQQFSVLYTGADGLANLRQIRPVHTEKGQEARK